MTDEESRDYQTAISTLKTRREVAWKGQLGRSVDCLINGLEEVQQRENMIASLFWRGFLLIPDGPAKDGLQKAAEFLRKIPEAG